MTSHFGKVERRGHMVGEAVDVQTFPKRLAFDVGMLSGWVQDGPEVQWVETVWTQTSGHHN